jgi:hypothetical protein
MSTYTTIGTSQAAANGFVPEVWAQEALRVLRSKIRAVKLIARDTDFEPSPKGSTLHIPYPGAFVATDKLPGEKATLQAPVGGMVDLVLNKHKTVDILLEDAASAQANSSLRGRYVNSMAAALANAVEDDVIATLLAGFSTDPIGAAGAGLGAGTVQAVSELFNTQLADEAGRALIVGPGGLTDLLSDSGLTNYFAFADAQAIRDGLPTRVFGVDILMSQRVPVIAGSPATVQNIALQRESAIIAMRPFADPDGTPGAQIATVLDEESGIVLRCGLQYSAELRGNYLFMDCLYGVKTLRAGIGVEVDS